MIDFSAAKTDAGREVNGVWRTWTNGTHEIDFLICRAGGANTAFRVRAEELTRVYRNSGLDMMRLPTDKQDTMNRELYADTIVKGWRSDAFNGLDETNFTRENLIHLMTEVPDVLVFLITEAKEADNYRNVAMKHEAGN